jgi:hypothetical protein
MSCYDIALHGLFSTWRRTGTIELGMDTCCKQSLESASCHGMSFLLGFLVRRHWGKKANVWLKQKITIKHTFSTVHQDMAQLLQMRNNTAATTSAKITNIIKLQRRRWASSTRQIRGISGSIGVSAQGRTSQPTNIGDDNSTSLGHLAMPRC